MTAARTTSGSFPGLDVMVKTVPASVVKVAFTGFLLYAGIRPRRYVYILGLRGLLVKCTDAAGTE
jgi:hypothetical protein